MPRPLAGFLVCLVLVPPATAHDVDLVPSIIIDTDMGLDDAVMLSAALQCPYLKIVGCVATEGVQDRETAADALGRMLHEFNRGDIALHEGSGPAGQAPPEFRPSARRAVMGAFRSAAAVSARALTPGDYRGPRDGKALVLVIGPLTTLAEALNDPAVVQAIDRVVVQGPPDPQTNWNLRFDRQASDRVRASGVALEFVTAGPAGCKPPEWADPHHSFGQQTSIGEAFVDRLLASDGVRRHYTQGVLQNLTDELVLLYAIDHDLFEKVAAAPDQPGWFQVKQRDRLLDLFTRLLSNGRQIKRRVVFKPGPLPDGILMPDVRMHKPGMLTKNGEPEWFAQLLMNELHEHLGSYSIVGVKMGLRAAELLNAPQHGMRVVSFSAPRPPVSCLNDGIIVATGSTPGRGLFRHEPGEQASTRVSFSYNCRTLTLQLKPEYRGRIQSAIDDLLNKYSLEDDRYWHGVRKMSLDIWENWHRRDLFEMVDPPSPPVDP